MMKWTALIAAGILEIVWAVGLKYTRLPSYPKSTLIMAVVLASAAGSFALLAYALRYFDVGAAYAIWTGIGAAGVAIVGGLVFDESLSLQKAAFVGLIVIGIVGLRVSP